MYGVIFDSKYCLKSLILNAKRRSLCENYKLDFDLHGNKHRNTSFYLTTYIMLHSNRLA